MVRAETLRVLRALCDGVDPVTESPMPPDNIFEKPPVLRALFDALRVLEGAPVVAARARPENHGRPWTDEEDHRLTEAFTAGRSGADIAREHGRSRGSIRERLVKLGLISE